MARDAWLSSREGSTITESLLEDLATIMGETTKFTSNPLATRGPLPFVRDFEEARALCERDGDNFYASAFMIEAWLGEATMSAAGVYAETKSGAKRCMQVGEAHRLFQAVFVHASDSEFPHVMQALFRFAEYDDVQAAMVARAVLALGCEHTGQEHPVLVASPKSGEEFVPALRRFAERLCQWLDAEIHWQTHEMFYLSPVSFDPDPEKRELAALGVNQRFFPRLSGFSKEWWQWHHGEAAERFKDSGKWLMIGKAAASGGSRSWAHPPVDEVTIRFWPLLLRHNWTYADLLNLVRDALPGYRQPSPWNDAPPQFRSPLDSEATFAAHCSNVLGLRKSARGTTAKPGQAPGYRVALRLLGRSLNEND